MPLNFILKNKYIVFFIPVLIYFISFFNQWHPQDDHEIALFTHYLKNHNFLETLKLTEVFRWGTYQRFRPTYFSLRIFESWLWGTNLVMWYLIRLLIQIFFLKEVMEWAKLKLNPKQVIFITTAMISLIFWRDLQTRLGPGETYCILGVTLISISLRTEKYNFLYFLGGLLAIGSKENFVITPLVIGFYLWRKNQFKIQDAFYLGLLFLYSTWVGIGIIKAVTLIGGDIYMSKVDPVSRVTGLLKGFLTFQLIPYLIMLFLIIKKKVQFTKDEWTALLISSFVLISNIFFYGGEYPRGNRYDFPGIPLNIIAWILVYFKIQNDKIKKYVILVATLFILSGLYRQTTKAFNRYRDTIEYTDALNKIYSATKKADFVILATTTIHDMETIVNIPRYLKLMGSQSIFYFYPQFNIESRDNHNHLKVEMETISKQGTRTEFSPLPEIIPRCIQVNFKNDFEKKLCEDVINF